MGRNPIELKRDEYFDHTGRRTSRHKRVYRSRSAKARPTPVRSAVWAGYGQVAWLIRGARVYLSKKRREGPSDVREIRCQAHTAATLSCRSGLPHAESPTFRAAHVCGLRRREPD